MQVFATRRLVALFGIIIFVLVSTVKAENVFLRQF